jgi:hypothetical protein
LVKNPSLSGDFEISWLWLDLREGLMSRALFLGTLLLVGPLSMAWAQNKTVPTETGPSFPGKSEMTFQWDYSCLGGKACSFDCPGAGGGIHVTKLSIYLGTIPIGSGQTPPAIFYDFSTVEIPHSSGFIIGVGLGALSCQVNGLTLDYAGPPKKPAT